MEKEERTVPVLYYLNEFTSMPSRGDEMEVSCEIHPYTKRSLTLSATTGRLLLVLGIFVVSRLEGLS